MRTVRRNILLNPGPATTTDTVKFAQVQPDICPREAEFGELLASICGDLTRLAADDGKYSTVLFGGSGTAAVESVISSVIGDGAAVIVNNGAYGKRMCEIASAYGLNVLEFPSPPDEPVDLAALEAFIRRSGRQVSHLAVVHHETTTGLLNDIGAIGQLCGRYDVDLIVDAMSSFGAIPIRMEDLNIRYLVSSANKCLQGMAGVSFVIADRGRLESPERPQSRNYYLNLQDQYLYFKKTNQMRFTPPVQTLYALKQAIGELKREGMANRYARYVKSWETLKEGITRLGLKYLVDDKHHAKMVTAILEPECGGYDFADMHDFFYRRGYTIYPGKLPGFHTFRIANMGAIDSADIKVFVALLGQYLRSIGG